MIHSIHPKWLEYSIHKTLDKLKIQTLDCVYLAEPLEMGMRMWRDPGEVGLRLGHAFAFLEELVQEGKIKAYGIQGNEALLLDPVWRGLLENRDPTQYHVFQIQELLKIARSVSGNKSHFKFL